MPWKTLRSQVLNRPLRCLHFGNGAELRAFTLSSKINGKDRVPSALVVCLGWTDIYSRCYRRLFLLSRSQCNLMFLKQRLSNSCSFCSYFTCTSQYSQPQTRTARTDAQCSRIFVVMEMPGQVHRYIRLRNSCEQHELVRKCPYSAQSEAASLRGICNFLILQVDNE
uniref:Uncharacterized protein n=1 Tax=Schistocephalus solidus TaxID=70667 RepID=A0A0V0J8H5_SCHSO